MSDTPLEEPTGTDSLEGEPTQLTLGPDADDDISVAVDALRQEAEEDEADQDAVPQEASGAEEPAPEPAPVEAESEPTPDEAHGAEETAPAGGVAPAEETAAAEGIAAAAPVAHAPAWPFIVYGAVWLVFSAAMTYLLLQTPQGTPTYEAELYPAFLFAGLGLTAAGPFLILAVWLASRGSSQDRSGLFISALYRGSVATMAGVAMWWAALLILDQLRLGHLV